MRRYGHFDTAEDAVQEALLAAARQWPRDGRPDRPLAWLITVAARRLTDLLRQEQARRRREDEVARWRLPDQWLAPAADQRATDQPAALPHTVDGDDTLILLFLCCHPALSPASQIALTLRAVGGLTTAEVARAFLVPEATMTRRISRAKQRIRDSGVRFALPPRAERTERLTAVLHALYLIFNEGYASTAGPSLQRVELAAEAIRLARLLHRLLPGDGEVTGLLALLLLTDARRPARTGPDGMLIPMAEQDRSRWDAAAIAEGVSRVTAVLPRGPTGPYQVQAAIAAIHDEAPRWEATDWPQIRELYEVLASLSDNPVVALNQAVAVAMVDGPRPGLDRLAALADDQRIVPDHRFHAVRAHLLELAGDLAGAREAYQVAAGLTLNLGQQRYLNERRRRIAR